MNPHQPMPQVQPAVPFPNGRPGHNPPYMHSPHPPQQGSYYPYQYPIHYQRPPPQWPPYPMPMPMQRGFQPYPTMPPYPVTQHMQPMRPSPHQAPSSSSIRSVQGVLSPSSSNTSLHPQSPTPASISNPHLAPPTPPPPPTVDAPAHRLPYYPPLPWQSFDGAFPSRAPRRRRRKAPEPQSSSVPVELPSRRGSVTEEEADANAVSSPINLPLTRAELLHERPTLETPSTSHPPSEALSTQPTTPSSTVTPQQTTPKNYISGRPNVPIIPIVPAIPNIPVASRPSRRASTGAGSESANPAVPSNAVHLANAVETAAQVNEGAGISVNSGEGPTSPPIKMGPKSWADLVRTMGPPSASAKASVASDVAAQTNGHSTSKAGSLADALGSYSVKDSSESAKIAFLEPRGLVNTGNMCYMNSVSFVL